MEKNVQEDVIGIGEAGKRLNIVTSRLTAWCKKNNKIRFYKKEGCPRIIPVSEVERLMLLPGGLKNIPSSPEILADNIRYDWNIKHNRPFNAPYDADFSPQAAAPAADTAAAFESAATPEVAEVSVNVQPAVQPVAASAPETAVMSPAAPEAAVLSVNAQPVAVQPAAVSVPSSDSAATSAAVYEAAVVRAAMQNAGVCVPAPAAVPEAAVMSVTAQPTAVSTPAQPLPSPASAQQPFYRLKVINATLITRYDVRRRCSTLIMAYSLDSHRPNAKIYASDKFYDSIIMRRENAKLWKHYFDQPLPSSFAEMQRKLSAIVDRIAFVNCNPKCEHNEIIHQVLGVIVE